MSARAKSKAFDGYLKQSRFKSDVRKAKPSLTSEVSTRGDEMSHLGMTAVIRGVKTRSNGRPNGGVRIAMDGWWWLA